MVMPQSTLESLLFFLILSLIATYIVNLKYSSKFDLIFDHKLKIDEIKRNEIVKMLEQKSKEKLKNLDYKVAIKAFRRAEKYFLI